MIRVFYFLLLILLSVSCASTKESYTAVQLKKFNEIVDGKPFSINSKRAYPRVTAALNSLPANVFLPNGNTINMIDITGHGSVFKFSKDSITIGDLPYYGERQFAGSYNNTNVGIEFDDKITNYKTSKTKRDNHQIKFTIRDKNSNTESYDVTLVIYKNLKTRMDIISTHRFPIQYSGIVTE
ncbi:DUF4251 domain-containing protein [Tenacibaculum jejuense]|uniref:Probable lipoprotein n=1 Tax=Tenacibaculum jejuense TaxID=584609 RepID=A0A238U9F3_9FLAO|nr:DUF4251 domain-containing protein [Tenacibaculum jejuense]SNR15819.1 Probable lipoprotein precursor [Tenacibaculum jejuense]